MGENAIYGEPPIAAAYKAWHEGNHLMDEVRAAIIRSLNIPATLLQGDSNYSGAVMQRMPCSPKPSPSRALIVLPEEPPHA